MKSIHVVAAIIKKDNQYLIVQRNKNKHLGLKFEFPGGKVDENESFESALKREIQEELNIEINIYKKIAEEAYKDEKIDIILHYYLSSQKNGTITLSEHENLAWVEKKDFTWLGQIINEDLEKLTKEKKQSKKEKKKSNK